MISKWFDNGNKCISIEFDSLKWYNIFRICNTDSKKGINSYIEKNCWILGFKFTYIDVDYDNIVFIKLNSKNNYKSSKHTHEINVLKETLITLAKDGNYTNHKVPFNWNFTINENDEYIFYITGVKDWFIKNGLEDLVNGLREITFNDPEIKLYPKYNPRGVTRFIKN